MAHIRSRSDDFGGQFMPENEGPRGHEGTAAAVFVLVHVRATNADLADPQQNHSWSWFRARHFLNSEILGTVQHAGQHGIF